MVAEARREGAPNLSGGDDENLPTRNDVSMPVAGRLA